MRGWPWRPTESPPPERKQKRPATKAAAAAAPCVLPTAFLLYGHPRVTSTAESERTDEINKRRSLSSQQQNKGKMLETGGRAGSGS